MVASILFLLAIFALAVAWVVRGGGDLVAYRRALRVSVALAVMAAALGIAGAVRWSDCIQVAGTSNYLRANGRDRDGNTITQRCARPGVLGIRDPWSRG
jgi:hypothetical protein